MIKKVEKVDSRKSGSETPIWALKSKISGLWVTNEDSKYIHNLLQLLLVCTITYSNYSWFVQLHTLQLLFDTLCTITSILSTQVDSISIAWSDSLTADRISARSPISTPWIS